MTKITKQPVRKVYRSKKIVRGTMTNPYSGKRVFVRGGRTKDRDLSKLDTPLDRKLTKITDDWLKNNKAIWKKNDNT